MQEGRELLDQLQAARQALEAKLAEAAQAMQALPAGEGVPSQAVADLRSELQQLKQQFPAAIKYNTESIVSLSAQLAQLEQQLGQGASPQPKAADASAMTAIRHDLQQLQQQLQNLPSPDELGSMTATLVNLQSKVSQLAEMGEEINTLHEALEFCPDLDAFERNIEVVAELRTALAGMEARLNTLPSEEERQQHRAAIADLEASLGGNIDGVTELRTALSNLTERFGGFPSPEAIAQLQSSVTELEQQLQSGPAPEVQRLAQQLEALSLQLSGFEEQWTENRAETTAIGASTAENLERLQTDLARLEESLQTQPEPTQVIEGGVANLQTEVAQLWQQFEQQLDRIEDLQTALSGLDTRLSSLPVAGELPQAQMEELSQQLSQLQGQFVEQTVAADVESLRAEIERLDQLLQTPLVTTGPNEAVAASVADLKTQLERLQQQLPEAVKFNTESIVSLAAQVSEMERQLAAPSEDTATAELVVAVQSELETVKRQLEGAIAAADLDPLRSELNRLAQKVDTQAQLQVEFDALQGQLDRKADVAGMAELSQQLDTKLDVAALTQSTEALATLQAHIDRLQHQQESSATQTDLEPLVAAIERLEALPEALRYNTESIVNVSERLDSLDLDGAIAPLNQRLADLASQLEGKVDAREMTALKQQIPEAIKYNTESIVSLHAQLSGLEERLNSVAERSAIEQQAEAIAILRAEVAELTQQLEAQPDALTQLDLAQLEQRFQPALAASSTAPDVQRDLNQLMQRQKSLRIWLLSLLGLALTALMTAIGSYLGFPV
jgi:DNA repair exonuclease SbcCD ATPase subunit